MPNNLEQADLIRLGSQSGAADIVQLLEQDAVGAEDVQGGAAGLRGGGQVGKDGQAALMVLWLRLGQHAMDGPLQQHRQAAVHALW